MLLPLAGGVLDEEGDELPPPQALRSRQKHRALAIGVSVERSELFMDFA